MHKSIRHKAVSIVFYQCFRKFLILLEDFDILSCKHCPGIAFCRGFRYNNLNFM